MKSKADEAIAIRDDAILLASEQWFSLGNVGCFITTSDGKTYTTLKSAIGEYVESATEILNTRFPILKEAENPDGLILMIVAKGIEKSGTHTRQEIEDAIGLQLPEEKLNPKDVVAYNARGIAYLKKGEYDRAIADYDMAIKLDPKDVKAYCNRGIAYKKKGDYDRAIADFDTAIKFDPEDVITYYNRGIAHKKKGEYDRAIADYDMAIKLDPRLAPAYSARGLVYKVIGQHDKAAADAQKAKELGLNVTWK